MLLCFQSRALEQTGSIMSFAILGVGTALPANRVDQASAAHMARIICSRTAEEATMLGHLFEHAGIDTRHIVVERHVTDDLSNGTEHSRSVFLPAVSGADRLVRQPAGAELAAAARAVPALSGADLGAVSAD